jgi:hypothetical protein
MMTGHHRSTVDTAVLGKNTLGELDLGSKLQPMMSGHHTSKIHTACGFCFKCKTYHEHIP